MRRPSRPQTTAFKTPTPAYERAVGLERLEHADVQASLLLAQSSVQINEPLPLEIELVNAGRATAQLIKVDALGAEGFDFLETPSTYPMEDRYLVLKGKRLEPLRTEEIRLMLRPDRPGVFRLRPRILYLDADGKYRVHEPEPVEVTVSK